MDDDDDDDNKNRSLEIGNEFNILNKGEKEIESSLNLYKKKIK